MKKTKAMAEQEAAERARIGAALRWSDDADTSPDVPVPAWEEPMTTGYLFNAYSRRVDVACSSSANHSSGRTDKTTTQGARSLYSTRERALRAMRVALELEFAKELAKIDRMLAGENTQ